MHQSVHFDGGSPQVVDGDGGAVAEGWSGESTSDSELMVCVPDMPQNECAEWSRVALLSRVVPRWW